MEANYFDAMSQSKQIKQQTAQSSVASLNRSLLNAMAY